MKKNTLLVLLLLSVVILNIYPSKPAHSATHVQCINMMQLYFLWLDQNKLKRAEKQFRVVIHSCHQLLKNKDEIRLLKQAIETDIKMLMLYANVVEGNNLTPKETNIIK